MLRTEKKGCQEQSLFVNFLKKVKKFLSFIYLKCIYILHTPALPASTGGRPLALYAFGLKLKLTGFRVL